MKPRVSHPALLTRRSASHHRRARRRSDGFRPAGRSTAWVGRLTSLGALLTVALVGWFLLSTSLWVVPAFAAVLTLPFVLAYLAVQFAGVLVALDEAR